MAVKLLPALIGVRRWPERQPAGTGRLSPGAFGLVPGELAVFLGREV